jgi:ribonucleoside-diphosphate reductase alpha chain
MTYTYKRALRESTEYFNGDILAAQVFVDKYALQNQKKQLLELTPTDMHWRIANEIARVEKDKFKDPLSAQQVFDLLDHFKYLVPQGSPMFGIGNPNFVTLSNCYVIDPPLDSYGGIMWTDEQIVQISKRRGGSGTDISHLRPNKAPTRNSSRTSTGPVCFANRFSNSVREVGQDGRRGALMLTLSVHHPDAVEFAQCKADKTNVTGANISIRLSDKFLQAVIDDTTYEQKWPVDSETPEISRRVRARDVWNAIIENAHAHAEPGLLFWDRIISESPADCYAALGFETVSTNPCSELPLSVLDSCRLLLLNTLSFVKDAFRGGASFQWATFFKYAGIAQRVMDDIVDLELEAVDKIIRKIEADDEPEHVKSRELDMWKRIESNCENGRRTGTGLTAVGDTLAALGIPYGSKKGKEFVEKLYRTLKFGCYTSSIEMAEELHPFPVFDHELESQCPFFKRFSKEKCDIGDAVLSGRTLMRRMAKSGRRNIALITSAPAGSCSMETQTSSGIEPLPYIECTRRKKGNPDDKGFRIDFIDDNGDHWMEFDFIHPQVQRWMNITGKTLKDKTPWTGSCAEDLNYKTRVELQAAAQQHVDHAISSTVNLPSDATVDDVKLVYETAWKSGCKGITVYRKGSRDGVILEKGVDKTEQGSKIDMKRPRSLPCEVYHTSVRGQSYFVLVGLLDGQPYEVFAGKNGFIPKSIKTGSIFRKRKDFYVAKFDGTDDELSPITAATNEMEEVVTRLTSLSLREGADMHRVVQQLEKVGERQELHSFARGVARILKKYIPDGTQEGEQCPNCKAKGGSVIRQEGCVLCTACGWSKCL